MDTTNDLQDDFNKLNIGATSEIYQTNADSDSMLQRHILSYQYPSLSLVTDLDEPLIDLGRPADIEIRTDPIKVLEDSGDVDTDFFIIMPKQHDAATPIVSRTTHEAVIQSIRNAASEEGATDCQIIRFYFPMSRRITTRIQILTVPSFNRFDFQLEEDEWQALLSYADDLAWVELLNHLVSRSSISAWKHVEDRMAGHDSERVLDFSRHDDGRQVWGVKRQESAGTIALRRMQFFRYMEPLLCGCYATLKELGTAEFEACPQCGKDVLTEDERHEADVADMQTEIYEHLRFQRSWAPLDELDPLTVLRPFRLECVTLINALDLAFETVTTCEAIRPESVQYERQPETKIAIVAMNEILRRNEHIEGTQTEIVDLLLREIVIARVEGCSPLAKVQIAPGWQRWLFRLVNRAVGFLCHRSCRRKGRFHRDLHFHQLLLFYNPKSWITNDYDDEEDEGANEESEEEDETDAGEISAIMEDAFSMS